MYPKHLRWRRIGCRSHSVRTFETAIPAMTDDSFLPIHVYDTATSRPVAVLLCPGKTASGIVLRAHLRRFVRRIRRHWRETRITIRGDWPLRPSRDHGVVRERLDAGDHLGDAAGDLDQAEPDRVELGVAPERGAGRQVRAGSAAASKPPCGSAGGTGWRSPLVAGGAVGGEVQLVRLDQVFGLSRVAQ